MTEEIPTDSENEQIIKVLLASFQALDVYKQGHSAALAGFHPADCPFDENCMLDVVWRNGWCDATLGVDVDTGLAAFQNMAAEQEAA